MDTQPQDQSTASSAVSDAVVRAFESQERVNNAVARALESLALQTDRYDARLEQIDRDLRFLDHRLESLARRLDVFTSEALGSRSVESEHNREGKHGR